MRSLRKINSKCHYLFCFSVAPRKFRITLHRAFASLYFYWMVLFSQGTSRACLKSAGIKDVSGEFYCFTSLYCLWNCYEFILAWYTNLMKISELEKKIRSYGNSVHKVIWTMTSNTLEPCCNLLRTGGHSKFFLRCLGLRSLISCFNWVAIC